MKGNNEGTGADWRLIAALQRGSVIEMTGSGWRLFHKNGKRGRKIKVSQFADLHDGGLLVRTDDRKSRVGEQWAIAAYSSNTGNKL